MDATSARALFDVNAPTYDRVNRVISLGLANRWYDWAASRASGPGLRVLDAFAGSGAVGLRAAARGADVTLADISPQMLARAQSAATERGLRVTACITDLTAEHPAVTGAPFDAIAVMWGLRYLDDPARVLRSLSELLGEGGRLVVVDFVRPEHASPASFYFFRVLPRIASALARRDDLYRELIATTRRVGRRADLLGVVESAGLKVIEQRVMGFGLVVGIVARPYAFSTTGELP